MRRSLLLVAWLATGPLARACDDTLDWAPGGSVPFDNDVLLQATARVGEVERLRPVLEKLSTKGEDVIALFISEAEAEDMHHPWSALMSEWLTRNFAAKVTASKLFVSGLLSEHLQVIPASAEMIKPDIIFVELSYTEILKPTKYSAVDHTPKYLVAENFMRALLKLPGRPAVVWVSLMEREDGEKTTEDTYSLLTEYYSVPAASVRSAWKSGLPFPSSELWEEKHLTTAGNKLVAVTVANFLCHEFLLTCQSTGKPKSSLRMALFSHTLDLGGIDTRKDPVVEADPGELRVPFCRTHEEAPAEQRPEAAPEALEGRHAWSMAVAMAVLPLILFQIFASFVGNGGVFLQNHLPQSMPELDILRVVATLNIVAWQYYQELPPSWAVPDNAEMEACRGPYYDYPDWTRSQPDPCPGSIPCTWCRSGKYCWQFFFLLQAFVTTLNMVRAPSNPIWQYAQVWPMHAFGLLLAIVSNAPVQPLDLLLTTVLAHGWITPFYSALNGASWYLSALVGFWIILPTWLRAADRLAQYRGVSGILWALLMSWLSMLALPFFLWVWPADFGLAEVDPRLVVHNFVAYSPYASWQPVAFGLLLAVLVMQGIEPRTQRAVGFCLGVPLLGLFIVWFLVPSPGFSMGTDFLLLEKGFVLVPLFSLLLLGCLGARNFPNRAHELLTGQTTLWLARLCWPVTILHQPVHRVCTHFVFPAMPGLPSFVYMLLYPLLLVLLSLLASRYIERPWSAALYRYRNRRDGESKHSANSIREDPNFSYEKVARNPEVKPFDPGYLNNNGYQRR